MSNNKTGGGGGGVGPEKKVRGLYPLGVLL